MDPQQRSVCIVKDPVFNPLSNAMHANKKTLGYLLLYFSTIHQTNIDE